MRAEVMQAVEAQPPSRGAQGLRLGSGPAQCERILASGPALCPFQAKGPVEQTFHPKSSCSSVETEHELSASDLEGWGDMF